MKVYKNKMFFSSDFKIVVRGKPYNLHEMCASEVTKLSNTLIDFMYAKRDLLTKLQISYEIKMNQKYMGELDYLTEVTDKERIVSVEKEIQSTLLVFEKVNNYAKHLKVQIILVNQKEEYVVKSIDDDEIRKKLKEGFRFKSNVFYKTYLNRRFVEKVDLRLTKKAKGNKINENSARDNKVINS